MPMERNKRPRVLRYLVYLVLVTTLITSSTLAKYAFQADFSMASHIAAFVMGNRIDLNMALDDMTPGSQKEVVFSVVNYDGDVDSEVQLEYEIQVSTTGNLPLQFVLMGQKEPDDSSGNSQLTGALDNTLKASGGKLPLVSEAGRRTHTYRLSVLWPAEEEAADYSNEIDMLTVTVSSWQSSPRQS